MKQHQPTLHAIAFRGLIVLDNGLVRDLRLTQH
jgi:hypothetical protein